MRSKKYVISTGEMLQWAMASWAEVNCGEELCAIDVGQNTDYRFNLRDLAELSPHDATAFIAWGPQFLNFRRLELMGELKTRGFKLPALVCHGAVVAASATLGENCTIGAGAVVGALCKIGFNSYIGAAAVIGSGAALGSSVWLADGVQVGAGARIGANAMLGVGVILASAATVGRQCILDIPGRRVTPLPDKSMFNASFPKGVFIVDGGGKPVP